MKKRKNRRRGFSLLILVFLLLLGSMTARAITVNHAPAAEQKSADRIVIDELKIFGRLERAPVVFYHDRHTQALAKQNKDCQTCHPLEDKRMSLKFQRTAEPDKQSVMDLYHLHCIGCHGQLRRSGTDSGPVTCGECHATGNKPNSDRRPIQLDRSLHFRHTRALADKCELCHHQFNEETKTLFYAKGQEGACLYCHGTQTIDNRRSNRQAAHSQCIACHRDRTAQKLEAGPIQCAGCHDAQMQQLIEKHPNPPRMVRNQPDATMIKNQPPGEKNAGSTEGMGPVAFDHRSHETYNDSCRVCHHADLGTCVRCHTRTGAPDGRQINLNQAIHYPQAGMSCVGCHLQYQSRRQCIGCHQADISPSVSAAKDSCNGCHLTLPNNGTHGGDEQAARAMAQKLLAQRPAAAPKVPKDQIPDTVSIQHLVDQFEAAVMPHRDIISALTQGIADNALAKRFHLDPATLCQGCHHHSPASIKPPACISCHGRNSDTANPARPGLMAAYHQQCMDCHASMGLAKPDARQCTACHAQRTLKQAQR